MAELIIYKDGAYNLWNTVCDAPRFQVALSRLQLEALVLDEQGADGMAILPDRLARAHATGTSSMHGTELQALVECNRSGECERCIPFDAFVDRFLTRRQGGNHE